MDKNGELSQELLKEPTDSYLKSKYTKCKEILLKYQKPLFLILLFILLAGAKAVLIYMINYMCESDMVIFTRYNPEFLDLIQALGNQWDSNHFVTIAQNWYPVGVTNDRLFAFAPLYPASIRFLDQFVKNPYLSGVIISNVFYFLSIIVFFLVARLYTTFHQSILITLSFGLFPTYLFYSTVAYSESMYLFFTLLSWYWFKKENYFVSSIFTSFCLVTRYISGFLLPLYVIIGSIRYYKMQSKDTPFYKLINWRLFWLVIPSVTLLCLFAYFQTLTGNFFVVFDSHIFFADALATPYQQFLWFFEGFFSEINPHVNSLSLMIERYMFTVPIMVMSFMMLKDERELAAYALVFSGLALSMVGISSLSSPRIILAAWPIFLGLKEKLSGWFYPVIYSMFFFVALWVGFQFQTSFFA